MQDLMQDVLVVGMDQGGANGQVTSTAAGDYVNMENFARVTFLLTTGAVTVGGKIGIRKAKNKSGASATVVTSAWDGGKYYKSATGSYASASSAASSGAYIVVGNSDDSKTIYGTFDATRLSASYPYVGAYFVSATWNAYITGTYLLHGQRYAGTRADPTA